MAPAYEPSGMGAALPPQQTNARRQSNAKKN
jgi:hypothetical protein